MSNAAFIFCICAAMVVAPVVIGIIMGRLEFRDWRRQRKLVESVDVMDLSGQQFSRWETYCNTVTNTFLLTREQEREVAHWPKLQQQ